MKFFIFLFILCVLLSSCRVNYIPKTGDLVFQDLDCGELCTAIEKVTSGVDGTNLSHVGVISVENDSIFVYEAVGRGVVRTHFDKFLKKSQNSNGSPKFMAGRLKANYQSAIPGAIKVCKSLLGKPYDDTFDLFNEKYYCSELVYFAFTDSLGKYIFDLNPMTFKDPDNGEIFPAWDGYFKKLNAAIPEGKPGINPGGISRSAKIDIVHKFDW